MKRLIIDSENPNGIILEVEDTFAPIPYEQRVVNRIRERYSVDDEIALLRQRVLKSDEFEVYNEFVERIKEEERNA